MPNFIFWRCRRCGNVIAKPPNSDKPMKCYNCRSGETPAGDIDLYEQIDLQES